jgi:hypothetical protein
MAQEIERPGTSRAFLLELDFRPFGIFGLNYMQQVVAIAQALIG